MENVDIVRLEEDRWEALKRLRLEAVLQDPGSFGQTPDSVSALAEGFWRDLLRNPSYAFYVVRVDGEHAGMGATKRESGTHSGHVATVFWIHVDQAKRRLGLGRAIMEHAVARLRETPGISKVQLGVHGTQEGAISLYEQLGFARCGLARRALRIDGAYVDLVSMELFFEEKL